MKLICCQPLRYRILSRTTHLCNCTSVKKFSGFPSTAEPVQVLYSKSNCPFENLAFEEYVYENILFDQDQRLLFLWRNKPSVVIGRHQNPWSEVNVGLAREKNVNVCRRQSGGGTVYHDLGNMNLTFFTARNLYKRKENLEFIIRTLRNAYDLDLRYNEKDDILFNGRYKVSGSAAKLGLKTAYHHCTLLCDTNMDSISQLLTHTFGEVETNATKSCPSPTANLFADCYDFVQLCKLFNKEYKRLYYVPAGNESEVEVVDPLQFVSVAEKANRLRDWQWIHEKTPAFTTMHKVVFKDGESCDIKLHIRKGIIVETEILGKISNNDETVLKFLLSKLHNVRFSYNDFVSVLLSENDKDGYRIVQIK